MLKRILMVCVRAQEKCLRMSALGRGGGALNSLEARSSPPLDQTGSEKDHSS